MRKNGICLLIAICIFVLTSAANATPYFNSISFYTEHNETFADDWSYQFGAFVNDSSVHNIVSVSAIDILTNTPFLLTYQPTLTGPWMWAAPGIDETTGPFLTQLRITAENDNGETYSEDTHILDPQFKLDLVENILISGPVLTPTFSWTGVAKAQDYRVRILDGNGDRIFDSIIQENGNNIFTTEYTLPNGVLTLGDSYTARIIANNYGGENGSSFLANRSSAYFDFTTPAAPIPEPATMLLFGTGLIGLAGASFRKKIK